MLRKPVFYFGVIVWKPPMFGFCHLFTPTFRNSRLHPNVWVLSSFHPRRFYRAELAAAWTPRQQLTGRGSHVAAMSAKVSSRPKSKSISPSAYDFHDGSRREDSPVPGPEVVASLFLAPYSPNRRSQGLQPSAPPWGRPFLHFFFRLFPLSARAPQSPPSFW